MAENSEIEGLQKQLQVARKEISNLRQLLKKLTLVHNKDINTVKQLISDYKCENCKKTDISNASEVKSDLIQLKPIGFIQTTFKDKKGVPRQSSVGGSIKGSLTISQDTFTNPEHSLEGLKEFSHLWIIYLFHKNQSHPKAKVAPPRLDGERVGVFSCRTPHRPCPIGLSLVQIDSLEGATLHFYGTDMVDGTPVLDIKPYIPQYDDPNIFHQQNFQQDFYPAREAPDGEETISETSFQARPSTSTDISTPVKVANWVLANHKLKVIFTELAVQQITELGVEIKTITEILSADPRSVYLRTNYSSQFYTFKINDCIVTSKFDDPNLTVTVLKIRKKENFEEELNNLS